MISGTIAVFYTLLFANVIEPDFVERLGNEVTAKQMAERFPQMTSDQIQQQVDIQENFFWVTYPFILIFSCIYGLFVGVFTGLFTRRS